MDATPFASLAQIRILLLPVGTIRRSVFEKYSGLVRSLEHIRLGDIPPDPREDKNRFIPSPLSAGSLHLHYTTHPPSAWHQTFSLFRLSSFPLAVIGIADCSQQDSLPSIGAEFKAALGAMFPNASATPFATKCFAFEDGDAIPDVNVGPGMPDLVMIPHLMSNKQVYIGTLLAELCHDILVEFPSIVRAIDHPDGLEALNANLLPSISKHVDGSGYYVHGSHRPGNNSSRNSGASLASRLSSIAETNGKPSRPGTPSSSTNGHAPTSNSSSLLSISTSKKRASTLGPSSGRLAKLVGDLYLLAGKLSDASYWYTEAISMFRTQQDTIWNASALEGQCTVEMLEAWSLGDSLHTSLGGNALNDPWANMSDKMGQAVNLYSRATPPNPSPIGIPDPELSSLVYLYTESILRYGRMLFAIWSGKGWNPLTLATLLSTELPPSFSPDVPSMPTLYRLSSLTNITRSQIAGIISQAHGPFLLHLQSSDRIQVLSSLAALYSCLGFKRKEAFMLREVQAAVMDLVVCGRDEARNGAPFSRRPTSQNSEHDVPPSPQNTQVSVRKTESNQGNTSVIKMARYVAQVYGVDLGRVGIADSGGKRASVHGRLSLKALPEVVEGDAVYGWPELQVGVVREALAVAEALPDPVAVAQFSLSTLRALHDFVTPQEQQHLSTSATRAISISRRRGVFQSMEFWFEKPLLALEITPIPLSRLPSEHPRSELGPPGSSAAPERSFMIYDPRGKKRGASLLLVQNESIDFTVTLYNPFLFDLEITSIYLSTSGADFQPTHSSTTVSAGMIHQVTLSGIALETGTLTVRGCYIQLPGGVAREFVLPLPVTPSNPRMSSALPPLRISQSPYDAERVKFTGLDANHLLRAIQPLTSRPEPPTRTNTTSVPPPPKFLQYQVVPEQPLLRVRRSSIAHGSLMLYDGETREIRLTVENISNIPVDYYKLSFDDSAIAPAQQLLADGEQSVADAYEIEYGLVHRPFFSWSAPEKLPSVAPGKRLVVPVKCHGKIGCSQGSIQMSYSYINRTEPPTSALDTYHSRQITYPVNITVYHTLELSNLDIIPLSTSSLSSFPSTSQSSFATSLPNLTSSETAHDAYCLISVDVNNIYGSPFEVTLRRSQEGTPEASMTRTVAPGCTCRLFIPVKRIMLPHSVTTSPIPSLSDRQFVVAKDKLSEEAERLQRELFWYREKLFELVQATWVEPTTGRTGIVSLRSQRLSLPMRDALRKVPFPIDISFEPMTSSPPVPSSSPPVPSPSTSSAIHAAKLSDFSFPFLGRSNSSISHKKKEKKAGKEIGGEVWHVKVYEIVKMAITVRNQCSSPKGISMSVGTVHPTPSELALFEGRQTDNFLGVIAPSDSHALTEDRTEGGKSLGVCFVSEGTFDILVDVVEVDEYGGRLPVTEKTTNRKIVKVIVHGEA